MQVEIHEVPDEGKPDQPETRDGKREVVELGPKPAVLFANATERIETDENGTENAADAENSEKNDPGSKAVDAIWIVGKGDHGEPPNVENEKQNTNEAHQETPPIIGRRVIERFSAMLTNDCRNRPEQNGQSHNTKPEEQSSDLGVL